MIEQKDTHAKTDMQLQTAPLANNDIIDDYYNTICDWCRNRFHVPSDYSLDRYEFTLEFVEGVDSHDAGYSNGKGYAVDALCLDCAGKLCDELIKLGINVRMIDY